MIYNDEYKKIEKFLEEYISSSLKTIPLHFHITVKDSLPVPYQEYPPVIRIGLRTEKVDRERQEIIKKWFKDTFNLDKTLLEREYWQGNKEVLYEMVYKPSKEIYDMIKILSKIN